MDRRGFLKTSVVVGGTALAGNNARAQEKHNPEEFVGILVDTTRCIGCRACEVACGEEHDLLVPDVTERRCAGKAQENQMTSNGPSSINTQQKKAMYLSKHNACTATRPPVRLPVPPRR